MASNWDTIAIPLVGGIDTKSDAKSAPPTKLVELENGVFTKRGSIRKRHGYDATPALDNTGAAITGEVLTTSGDSLLLVDEQDLYSYDDAKDDWVNQGYLNRVSLGSDEVEAMSNEQSLGDRAEANGVTVRAYMVSDGAGGTVMEVTISSTITGAVLKKLTGGTVGTGNKPRCVRVGAFIHVVFAVGSTTDLYALLINPFNPAAVVDGDAVIIASDLHADEIFDVVENSDRSNALFAWYSTAANTVRFGRLFQSGATANKGDEGATAAVSSISVAANSNLLVIASVEGSNTRITTVENVNGALSPATNQRDVLTFNKKVSITCTETRCFWIEEATIVANPENQVLKAGYGVLDATGLVSSAQNSNFMRHSSIGSAGFSVDGRMYFFVKHESAKQLQNCYFLIHVQEEDKTGRVVGQVEYGTGTPLTNVAHLPRFSMGDDGVMRGLLQFRRKVNATNNDGFMHLGLKEVSVDPSTNKYTVSTAGGAAYVPGGQVWYLDGKDPVEASFHLFPEPDITFGGTSHSFVSVTQPATDEAIVAGTYAYKIYYEWFGANGELMRSSAVSFSVLVSVTSKVTLTIPTLEHTLKGDGGIVKDREEVSIGIFRTNGTTNVLNRVSGIDPNVVTGDNRYVFNDRTMSSVTFVDNMDKTASASKEIDPQTGGVLDNISLPSCDIMLEAQRRLFMAGGVIPSNRVAFTKLRIDGVPIEGNDALSIELPDRGGVVTALASLNESLVVWKERQIYIVTGDGPNNLGFGDFQEPVQVASDVGCIDARSVVETPDGLMFQSRKGIYLLGKDFSVVYIGADAEAFNDQSITSAELVPDQNIAIFLSSDGVPLVYDYLFRQWGTFTGHQGESATLWDNKYCYLRSDGQVYRQNSSKFTDGGVAYKFRAKTAPIRIDSLQQWWRVKRIYVLGEYFSSHSLRMNLFFNREAASFETVTWTPSDFIEDSKWGDEATWGGDDVWGGPLDSRDYQMSYAPSRQKVQSISLEFEEIPGTEPGRSFELTELAFRWAPKSGLGRLDAARRK